MCDEERDCSVVRMGGLRVLDAFITRLPWANYQVTVYFLAKAARGI